MTKDEFLRLLNDQLQTLIELTMTKGEEYSRDDDQLANFKRQATELDMNPEKVLMVYLNKHLDAVKSYVKTGRVLSESIDGRINDAILYLVLLKAVVRDGQSQAASPSGQRPTIYAHSKADLVRDPCIGDSRKEDTRPRFELR